MKISVVNNLHPAQRTSFKQENSIEHLSGLDIVKKYEEITDKKADENRTLNNKLDDVLYNAIFIMEQNGKYKEAKILYDAFVDDTQIYDDPNLNNTIGRLNKKMGDIEQAKRNFDNAYYNLKNAEDSRKIDIIKNYFESNIILGNKELTDEIFVNQSYPYTDEIYLYLTSILDNENNDKLQESNNIKAAYRIGKSLGYMDDDIILKNAFILSEEGDYENSNKIILENLDRLRQERKVYTKEFADYLLLLGINSFETSDEETLNKSTNIFKNVSEISEITGLSYTKEIADYSIAKNLYIENSENFYSYAQKLLDSVKNKEYKISLNEMLADFLSDKNQSESSKYYENAISILERDEIKNKNRIFELYKKLEKVSPQEIQKIEEKIKELNVENLYDTKHLIDSLISTYSKTDYKKLEDITKRVLEKSDNKTHKTLAQIFLNLAKLKQGSDMNQCIKQIDSSLSNLKETFKKTKSKNIEQVICYTHKNKAGIFFNALRYRDAANEINEALKYLNEDNNSKDTVKKNKIIATLYNYKAKNYITAEIQALDYLGILLDKKFKSTKPKNITSDVDEYLKNTNDTQKRKIASAYETLGLINLKNHNFKDSQDYFMSAVEIRERLKDKDLALANSYAALSRLAIFNSTLFKAKRPNSSKELHKKCLEILKAKYPNEQITAAEEDFHKKYYGTSLKSAGKYIKNQFVGPDEDLIDKFKCYYKDKELSICE